MASMGDGTADADGWVKMTVQWGQSLPFPLFAGIPSGCFLMAYAALVPCPLNPLTTGTAYLRVFIFFSTLSTTFQTC